MSYPHFFIESTDYLSSQYPEITETLKAFPDICIISERTFQFKIVGTFCIDERPVIVFPKGYDLPVHRDLQIQETKVLIRVLLRYRNEMNKSNESSDALWGLDDISSNRIAAAMLLLEDYCQNGYLKRYAECRSSGYKRRTDWPATINKTVPLYSKGNPVYDSPIARWKKNDIHNIVVLAHKYVIQDCFRKWGWLFGYDLIPNADPRLPCPISEIILCLKTELRKTYINRDIMVIHQLIQYLSASTGKQNSRRLDLFATPYFSFVWEAICGFLFNNSYPKLKKILPQPIWESNIVSGRIAQRPDIFYVEGENLYILDAKYYNYHKNLPGWHDVVKQLFYRHSLEAVSGTLDYISLLPETKKIFNAFILPGDGDDFLYLGQVYVPKVKDLGTIKAIVIDQKRAFATYAARVSTAYSLFLRRKLTEIFQ